MRGLNKRFMNNPAVFLAALPLRVRARSANGSPFANTGMQTAPHIYDFDLQDCAPGVELHLFAPHPKTHRFGTQRPIRAYWLDYEHGRAVSVRGNLNAADYLFTPIMDGCYFAAGVGGVAHVAGDVLNARIPGTMQNHATVALGPYGVGFDSNRADAHECMVVGVRGQGGWSWYVQGHGVFYNGGGVLQAVFNSGNHAGLNVITINDMTYG